MDRLRAATAVLVVSLDIAMLRRSAREDGGPLLMGCPFATIPPFVWFASPSYDA